MTKVGKRDGERGERRDGVIDGAAAPQRRPRCPSGTPPSIASTSAANPTVTLTGRPWRDEARDALIAHLVRKAEIAVREPVEIAQILHAERPVEAVEMIEIGAHLRRQRALLVEGAARGEADHEEGQRDENQQGRDGSGNAADRVTQHR